MFEVWQVAGVVDELHPGIGDSSGKLLSINRRDDAIGRAPDDERRRRNAVSVLAKSAIGDRPDEFTRTGLRPDELRERVDAFGGVAWNNRNGAAPLPGRVGKGGRAGAPCRGGSPVPGPARRPATNRPDRSAPTGRPSSEPTPRIRRRGGRRRNGQRPPARTVPARRT